MPGHRARHFLWGDDRPQQLAPKKRTDMNEHQDMYETEAIDSDIETKGRAFAVGTARQTLP
jgi:hypothetical protein